jgi:anti-sigma factor RsiW
MMARCDSIAPLLGDFVDGALAAQSRGAVEAHVAACERCRDLVTDLASIRAAAGALGPLALPDTLWPRLRTELGAPGRGRVNATASPAGRPAWLALAAALILTVGGALGSLATEWRRGSGDATITPSAAQVAADLDAAEEHYLKAIAGLEQIARSGDSALDPQLASVLRTNLRAIDSAIGEARAALDVQPDDASVQRGLLDALEGKVALLENTVTLIGNAQADVDDEVRNVPQ